MNNKVKGKLSIFLMSAIFFMMLTTNHHRALGDYVLEFIGLKSWSGDYIGTHMLKGDSFIYLESIDSFV